VVDLLFFHALKDASGQVRGTTSGRLRQKHHELLATAPSYYIGRTSTDACED
jgi:hypothetical protein